jgi:hypothetical protein
VIDEYSTDGTGWARFSDDRTMRYHLGRLVSDRAREIGGDIIWQSLAPGRGRPDIEIAVFLMLNPSDADAFKPDPTVGECVKFTRRWGHDVTWVVNEHAFRSPYPSDLKKLSCGMRGDDVVNNQAIMLACSMANIVITAWGNDGALDYRDRKVLDMLRSAGIRTHHLGVTKAGHPKHPLARGKHRIAADQQPIAWSSP